MYNEYLIGENYPISEIEYKDMKLAVDEVNMLKSINCKPINCTYLNENSEIKGLIEELYFSLDEITRVHNENLNDLRVRLYFLKCQESSELFRNRPQDWEKLVGKVKNDISKINTFTLNPYNFRLTPKPPSSPYTKPQTTIVQDILNRLKKALT